MADIERILIVGGGIAGLSAAAALSRQGFSAELVERSATWPAIGAGINLPANVVRVLQALGLRAPSATPRSFAYGGSLTSTAQPAQTADQPIHQADFGASSGQPVFTGSNLCAP